MSRTSNDGYSPKMAGEHDEDSEEGLSTTKSSKIGDRVVFITRALVKNNIVG
jgi:hypothetical protein